MKTTLPAKSIFLAVFFGVLASVCGTDQTANSPPNLEPATNASGSSNTGQRSGVSVEVDSLTPANQQESSKIDDIKASIPDEFKEIDFRNMNYPIAGQKQIKLVDGEFESRYDTKNCDNHFGSLNGIYYVDLNGDGRSEALVDFNYASCGCGSCDGGSHVFYAYRLRNRKVALFWTKSTGGLSYGGLKSIQVRPRTIVIEEFGKLGDCQPCYSKFQAKDVIRTRYIFRGSTFIQQSRKMTKTDMINIMNYPRDVDISN